MHRLYTEVVNAKPWRLHWVALRSTSLTVFLAAASAAITILAAPEFYKTHRWLLWPIDAIAGLALIVFVVTLEWFRIALGFVGLFLIRLSLPPASRRPLPGEADDSAKKADSDPSGWREAIVCLVDIAGFNPFLVDAHDTDLSKILRDLDKALIDNLHPITNGLHADSDIQTAIATSARSTLSQPMGGRAMLVWEYPVDGKVQVEEELALLVVDFMGGLQDEFYANLDDLSHRRVRNESLKGLRIRIALSCGKVWKRYSTFGGELFDYTGLPVNEAMQLLYQALPKGGLIVNLHLEPYLFMERYCAQEGRIDYAFLEGTDHVIPFWVLEGRTAMLRRCAKRNLLSEFEEACRWLLHPYQQGGPVNGLAISADDTTFVFQLREKWEPQFAKDLALRVCQGQISANQLRSIERTIAEMEAMLQSEAPVTESTRWSELGLAFHSQIAELSDGNEGRKRKVFTEAIYAFTSQVYKAATSDPSIVVKEHRAIATAIGKGDSARSYKLVEDHLRDHYERAKKALLEIDRDSRISDTRYSSKRISESLGEPL
jgi:hypothetical protein